MKLLTGLTQRLMTRANVDDTLTSFLCNIVNYSAKDTRRIDLTFGIGYDDVAKARNAIQRVLDSDERIKIEFDRENISILYPSATCTCSR